MADKEGCRESHENPFNQHDLRMMRVKILDEAVSNLVPKILAHIQEMNLFSLIQFHFILFKSSVSQRGMGFAESHFIFKYSLL